MRTLQQHMDVMLLSYYDASTGALVAIWQETATLAPSGCLAGPADVALPSCTSGGIIEHCPDRDAGVDR